MRKGIIFLYALATLGLSTACESWLKVEPQNDIILEDYWKSKEDVRSGLTAVYSKLREQTKTLFLWGELRSGSLIDGPAENQDFERVLRLEILRGNSVAKWGGIYQVINLANTVIKYAPEVRKSDLSLSRKELNGYMSEAYFLRSACYFYLLRTFKEIPLHLEPTDSDDVDIHLPGSPEADVLARIIEDLEWAERYAVKGFEELEDGKGLATKAAIQALLADVYLWNSQYDECVLMCDKIINRAAYRLMEKDAWDNIFSRGNTNEGIYEIQFDASLNQHLPEAGKGKTPMWTFLGPLTKDQPEFLASPTMIGKFEEEDVRGEDASYIAGRVSKFYLSAKRIQLDANWILYRYADVLLMKAEALVQKGDYFGAQKELNLVRERAGLADQVLPDNRANAEDMILEERAREFAFEGKRWFDLLRYSKRNNFERKNIILRALLAGVEPGDIPKWTSLLSDPDSYYLPIHIDELRSNPELVQNPYYD
ncbi:membrane protein (plasmid) [Fulvitalea axinellae]|uniref:Membrane protein n=1 Tax=Fulvitalea axinellae TaxID=1182444 RepID=A0AAU9CY99_9BACT|nr:membrane protein [Fulvitalea axinellae]